MVVGPFYYRGLHIKLFFFLSSFFFNFTNPFSWTFLMFLIIVYFSFHTITLSQKYNFHYVIFFIAIIPITLLYPCFTLCKSTCVYDFDYVKYIWTFYTTVLTSHCSLVLVGYHLVKATSKAKRTPDETVGLYYYYAQPSLQ